jgi:hypothetical protein
MKKNFSAGAQGKMSASTSLKGDFIARTPEPHRLSLIAYRLSLIKK